MQNRRQAGNLDTASRRPAKHNPLYFDTSKAIVFAGTFTESRLAAWLELKLIQFAFSLDIGVNNNRDSPYNMACLPGENYSETRLALVASTWFLFTPTSPHKATSRKCM